MPPTYAGGRPPGSGEPTIAADAPQASGRPSKGHEPTTPPAGTSHHGAAQQLDQPRAPQPASGQPEEGHPGIRVWKTKVDGHTTGCICTQCKAARAATQRQRYQNGGKTQMRANHLRRTYGITAEHYDQMHRKQHGLCAICRQPETRRRATGEPFSLAVDHDHETGRVRALLCQDCNQALGLMLDDPTRLTAAARYLRKHAAQTPIAHPNPIGPNDA